MIKRTNDAINLIYASRGPNNLLAEETLLIDTLRELEPVDIGFANYSDVATKTVPITVPIETWTAVTNDLAGVTTRREFLPRGVERLMVTGGDLNLSQCPVGSMVLYRQDMLFTPNANNTQTNTRLRFGIGSPSEFTIALAPPSQLKNVVQHQLIGVGMVFIGDDHVRTSPARVEVKADLGGTLINNGMLIVALIR